MKEKLVIKQAQGCRAGGTVSFDETIEIPKTLMTSNEYLCKVFQIKYVLRVIAETSGMSVSPEFEIPITIGSVGFGADPAASPKPLNLCE